ncbi:hypothetical protein BDN70DRAFT_884483 [Pholiota conissans]|uniref:Uncharacterized protein n=1 Tax=Pholiota conissans TaxID=109636 RepID=A0A9P5YTD4_9AGAR|nr:hypothetical protein BDN70DRAFT_884483 [Pholiota conissans]
MSKKSHMESSTPTPVTQSEKIQQTTDNPPPENPVPMGIVRSVSPPLSSAGLSRFIYVLLGLVMLMCGYYFYRALQYKREEGGWWSIGMSL